MKLSEKEIQKKIGKREPLPGGPKQQGPNFKARPAPSAPASSPKGTNFLNPKAVQAKREKEASFAGGGKVRGCGAATRGTGKAKMY